MMKSAVDYIQDAINKCQKDIETAKRKSEEALGMHLDWQTIGDPAYSKQWDNYFKTDSDTRVHNHSKFMNEAVILENVLRLLENTKFDLQIRTSKL